MPAETSWASVAIPGFLACWAYSVYAFVQVARNREPGSPWWHRVPFSGETLTERGRRYLRRFYGSMLLGALIVLVSVAVR
jgi:hypothetical protein